MINLLIVIAGFAIIVISVAVWIVIPLSQASTGRRDGQPVSESHVVKGVVGAIIGALILVAGLSSPFVEVPAGNVGVVTNFGSVQPGRSSRACTSSSPSSSTWRSSTPGSSRTSSRIDAASAEYQTVRLTGVMNYHVDGQFANDLYQRVGTDFASKVIDRVQ